MRHRLSTIVSGLAAATAAILAPAAPAVADVDPNAGMLRWPDISGSEIVFAYANDLWIVDAGGGTARPLASPPGAESRPRFSPDGRTIAFMGNYDGGRDLYTIPHTGGVPVRVTHHPTTEVLCDWHDDEHLLFSGSGVAGLIRQPKLYSVAAEGGLPAELPVPYGAAGAVSPDGTWLAYTPNNRDTRTWKRYRGGMASDVWLFNLETMESRRVTDWEGTDTQPMWAPNGDRVLYYLSDAGPSHRLNIWKYDVARDRREQVTTFDDYDVKWPSIGPGRRGSGSIIFQHASDLKVLDLANGRIRPIEITIPGARPTLRPKRVDASSFISDWGLAPKAVRAVAEARGDLWTLPAKNGSPRNLTATDGVAERDPSWSPDGRWIAYFADATGEYELYVRQSDGKGDVRQLTRDSKTYYYQPVWSPDGEAIAFNDRAGHLFVHDLESGDTRRFDTDVWGGNGPIAMSWSSDARWIAYARATEASPISSIHLYDRTNDAVHQVTHGMFGDSDPVFDHKGEYLYFASQRNFSPSYSQIDTTFVYDDASVLIAVPLQAEQAMPWAPKSDEVTWETESDGGEAADEAGEAADEDSDAGEAAEGADGGDEDRDRGSDRPDAVDRSAIAGTWKGTVNGLSAVGAPPEMDSVPFTMTIEVDDDGEIRGSSEAMGESSDFDEITFDPATGRFMARTVENGVTSVLRGTLDGDEIAGEWELVEVGAGGTWEAKRTARRGVEYGPEIARATAGGPAIAVAVDASGVTARPVERDLAPAAGRRDPFFGIRRAAAREQIRTTVRERLEAAVRAGIIGTWEGEISGLSAMGLPPEMDTVSFSMVIGGEPGSLTASMSVVGEVQDFDTVTFDAASGRFEARGEDEDGTSVLRGTLTGDRLAGEWEVEGMGASGSWSAKRAGGGDADAGSDAAAGSGSGDDAESGDDSKAVTIDLEGFEARGFMLPVAPGAFGNLAVNNRNQLLYVRAAGPATGIKLFDLADDARSEKDVQTGAGGFILSPDGASLIYPTGRGGMIRPASAGGSGSPVVTRGMITHIAPRAEWAQLVRDAWRIQRDFFYVENLHGVDWDAVWEQYSAMLADAITRDDVSYIIREMISELNVGHAYYWGGDVESAPTVGVGLLGVDWELHDGAYRVKSLVHGADWDVDARNPLHLQSAGIEPGHYVLAVNGEPVDTSLDPWAAFLETAGREITLTVSEKPTIDADARDVVVRPVGNDAGLRYRGWIESKRRMVDEATDGQVGYIYVPNTGVDGQNDLFRQFYGQIGKKALIIDERWNGGGQIPTRFIELLNRPVTNFWARRDAIDWKWPPDAHHGPKCMLINGLAGSGGDMFPWLFKQAGLGPLVGTRTWGGLVGISGNPTLIDGGYTAVPTFGFYETDGTWGIEGHGVDPDIEVVDDPAKMVDGGDPQLERAIAEMLKAIRSFDYPTRDRPAAPDRSGMGIRDADK